MPISQSKTKGALVQPRSCTRNQPHAHPTCVQGDSGSGSGEHSQPQQSGLGQQLHLITAEWVTSQANAPDRNLPQSKVIHPLVPAHLSRQMSPFPLLMPHVRMGGRSFLLQNSSEMTCKNKAKLKTKKVVVNQNVCDSVCMCACMSKLNAIGEFAASKSLCLG